MCKRGPPWFGDQCVVLSEAGVWVSIGALCNVHPDTVTPWLCRTRPVNWEQGPWSQFTALTLGTAVQAAIWGQTQRKAKAWGYQERESWMNEGMSWVGGEQPGEEMAVQVSGAGGRNKGRCENSWQSWKREMLLVCKSTVKAKL